MLSYETGIVKKIVEEYSNSCLIEVELENRLSKAMNYKAITGEVALGDIVSVNTTAVELGLGTGGLDFVIFNQSNEAKDFEAGGHIMKLRYTPQQIKCMSIEEETSPYHEEFLKLDSIDGHKVIVGTLHSMLAPLAAAIKYLNPNLRVNYIMTDGGSLPIEFSNTVRMLKKDKLIDNTITIGHAFGGDYEAVNIYNGLLASRGILKGDITIITMGPGIVGTGTKYGFSGIEQGQIIDAVNTLSGCPILVPRIGFKDARDRHIGISHQSRTVLNDIIKTGATVVFSEMDKPKKNLILKQLESLKGDDRYDFKFLDGSFVEEALEKFNYNIRTMGRDISSEREFFYTLGAVSKYAVETL